jgi:ribose/xylose/arabinose/galactoside ABC-type transport system permease subunit
MKTNIKTEAGKDPGAKFVSFMKRQNIPVMFYGVIVMLILFGFLTNGRNFSGPNLLLILRNSSVLLLASIGMTMVILVSQVDLSIGSVMSMAAVITAVTMNAGLGTIPAIGLGILSGIAVGMVNGLLIAVFRFDYWISTFATMGIGGGLALVIASGGTVPINSRFFNWIGSEKILGIYLMVYITVIFVLLVGFLLKHTKFGYNIYAIGGSEQSAILSGVDVVKNRMAVYICSGFFSSIAGMVLASLSNSANPIGGVNYSFDAMAAVIIGGTGFDGGRGGIYGTVLGAVILRVLSNGLGIMGIPSTWQKAIIGMVIVMVLVVDALTEKHRKTRELRRVYTHE